MLFLVSVAASSFLLCSSGFAHIFLSPNIPQLYVIEGIIYEILFFNTCGTFLSQMTRDISRFFLRKFAFNNNNNVFNSYRSTPRYIQCNLIYEKKRKFVQKRIQHGEWYNTTANCMLTDILSRMENAPSQPPSQPIHIARLRTTMPGTLETPTACTPRPPRAPGKIHAEL